MHCPFFGIIFNNRENHMKNDLVIFEGTNIRRLYDEKTETWYFSVVDILQVLITAAGLSDGQEVLE